MKPDEIASIHTSLGKLNPRSISAQSQQEIHTHRIPAPLGRDVVKKSALNFQQLKNMDQSNIKAHAFAQQVRKINETLDAIEDNLSRMRAALENIVKIYPPYPIGSAKRNEALQELSALRDVIDKLTYPLRQDYEKQATNDRVGTSRAGAGQDTLTTHTMDLNDLVKSLTAGPKGLDIPEVSTDISDEQLNQVLLRTTDALQTLNLKRQEFYDLANHALAGMNLGQVHQEK